MKNKEQGDTSPFNRLTSNLVCTASDAAASAELATSADGAWVTAIAYSTAARILGGSAQTGNGGTTDKLFISPSTRLCEGHDGFQSR